LFRSDGVARGPRDGAARTRHGSGALTELSLAEARRIALGAQGFGGTRQRRRVDAARLAKVLRTIGVLQLDFVNVLVPAHYLIPFSRVGPYDRKLLDEVTYRSGEFVEHVAHEASVVPVEHWPLLCSRPTDRRVRALEPFMSKRVAYAARILEAVRAQGPLAADGAPASDEPEPERDWRSGVGVITCCHFSSVTRSLRASISKPIAVDGSSSCWRPTPNAE